jgi:hypothetical protein
VSTTYTLDEYIRHVDLFGSECVLETVADDLSRYELGQLKAYIESKERTHRFRGGRWEERRAARPRPCDACGLDLPLGIRENKRYHDDACRKRHVRAKARHASKDTG